MVRSSIIIEIPTLGTIPNRVSVIKAIRTLSGMGLKEAKDLSEMPGRHTLKIPLDVTESVIDDQLKIFNQNGVKAGGWIYETIERLRQLGIEALEQGEDELANEILQLVLAEKLRRNPDKL